MQALRKKSGLTVRGLARELGINDGHLSRIERGERPGSPALARAIADRLDVPLDAVTQKEDKR